MAAIGVPSLEESPAPLDNELAAFATASNASRMTSTARRKRVLPEQQYLIEKDNHSSTVVS
jgi:hypothetical protein